MSKRIAATLMIEAVAIAGLLTLALDMRAHSRVEGLGGVNIWGYRGPVMLEKKRNETRIAVAGGDLAFGWGVAASETVAPTIRQLVALAVDRPGRPARTVTAVNLGALGLPPEEYAARIEHYAYLRPDVVCLYADPAPRMPRRAWLPPADSAIFAATGYAPILPLVLADKGRGWRSPTVERAGRWLRSADAWLYRIAFEPPRGPDVTYAVSIERAVRLALSLAGRVVIVAPPYRDGDADRHGELVKMVASSFGGDRRVRLVDLGDVDELADDDLRLDGVNLSTAGHAKVAEEVTPAVLDLIESR